MSTFDKAFAEYARIRDIPSPHWTSAWPREDPRIAAIKALVDSAPTCKRGEPKNPEAAILASIRALLKENR